MREHPGVRLVVLGLALRDGAQLAGVGHDHRVPQGFQQPADPRAVRAGLHHAGGSGVLVRKRCQALAGVDDFRFGEDLAGGGEDAYRMAAIPEVDSDGGGVRAHKAERNRPALSVRGAPRLLIPIG